MILGICVSFPKLGSAVNAAVSPAIAKNYHENEGYENVGIPLFLGLGLMVISLGFGFLLAYFDKKSEKKEKIHHESIVLSRR